MARERLFRLTRHVAAVVIAFGLALTGGGFACKTTIVDTIDLSAIDTLVGDDLSVSDVPRLDLVAGVDGAGLSDGGSIADATDDPADGSGSLDGSDGPSGDLDSPSGNGTTQFPFLVTSFPFVHDHDTNLGQSSQFQRYSCAPTTGEEGPEVVYQLSIPANGTLRIDVVDSVGVDVDIQLLGSLALVDGTASDCLARHDSGFSRDVQAGTYFVVADSYSTGGTSYQGPYTLAIEFVQLDVWQSVALRPGVTWKKKVYSSLYGERQTVNVLELDLAQPGIVVKPSHHGGCARTSEKAATVGALAAINGGFFDTATCLSLDMVKVDGALISTNHLNGTPQPTLGITAENLPLIEMVAANGDWDAVTQALGGYPNLLSAGQLDIQPNLQSSFFTGANPRTAVCLTSSDKLLLVTVDGRTSAGGGMSIPELAQYMLDLGCDDAMNLDGGGSTTMWVRRQSINGIVNYPSDNGRADHLGERKVSDSLQLFAP
ncbi:MAG: phosphodiester glycosidase family protein [Myxococcales bacterium]|nr:phosphodiester glycosidase family protein [Myxococcales bacterium]